MADSAKKSKRTTQLIQGLRAGEAILGFFALFGGAFIASGQSQYFRPIVGWLLLSISGVVLILEVERWVKILPAIFIYGVLMGLRRVFWAQASNYPLSRYQEIWLTVLCAAITAVSTPLALRRLNRVDHVALLAFVALFVWGFVAMSSLGPRNGLVKMSLGWGCLLVACVYDLLQRRRGNDLSPPPVGSPANPA